MAEAVGGCWVCKIGEAEVYGGHLCGDCPHVGTLHGGGHPHRCIVKGCPCPGYSGRIRRVTDRLRDGFSEGIVRVWPWSPDVVYDPPEVDAPDICSPKRIDDRTQRVQLRGDDEEPLFRACGLVPVPGTEGCRTYAASTDPTRTLPILEITAVASVFDALRRQQGWDVTVRGAGPEQLVFFWPLAWEILPMVGQRLFARNLEIDWDADRRMRTMVNIVLLPKR